MMMKWTQAVVNYRLQISDSRVRELRLAFENDCVDWASESELKSEWNRTVDMLRKAM